MKHTLSLFTVALMGLVALAVAGFAEVPAMISYQGILTDAGGDPVADDTYELTFKIYDQTPTERWSETHSVATVDGLFSVLLGSNGTPLTDTHLDYAECWLGITLTGDPEMTPRSQLISSPFALQAEVAQEAQSALTVADNSVTSAKIADGEVITDDLDDEAVTSLKIADATIRFVDIAANGATEGQVMKMVGGNWVAADDDGGSGADADWTIAGNDQYSAVSGNVGIGITTPSYKLHVNGGNGYFNQNLYAMGDVGIGTVSPTARLHVAGDSYITGNADINGDVSFGSSLSDAVNINGSIRNSYPLYFEGATVDAYQTGLYIQNPTADRFITFPDASGTVAFTGSSGWIDNGSTVRLANTSDNVGIGVSGTASKLHVVGETALVGDVWLGSMSSQIIRFAGTVIGSTPLVFEGAATDAYETSLAITNPTADQTIALPDASGTVALTSDITAGGWTDDGSYVRLNSVGDYVGIGTSSPGYKLHVAGTSYASGNLLTGGRLGIGTTTPSFDLDVVGNSYISGSVGIGGTPGGYKLFVNGGNGYFGGNLYANGNVGIGTSSPSTRLEIVDNGTGVKISRAAGTSSLYLGSGGLDFGVRNDGSGLAFWESAGGNRMYIQSGGNVGIGTTSPICDLHVEGTSLLNGSVGIGLYPTIYRLAVTGGNGYFGSNLYAMGNVGIGTTSPSVALHVVGAICHTGGIGSCSDARYKKDVETVSGALGMVSKLRGVRFDWRHDEYPEQKFSDGRQLGFIAQEVKEIFPEVIMQDDDGYYSVDYAKLTPVLVEAVKELKAEVVELKADHAASLAEMQVQLAQVSQLVETLLAQNEPDNSNSKKLAGK